MPGMLLLLQQTDCQMSLTLDGFTRVTLIHCFSLLCGSHFRHVGCVFARWVVVKSVMSSSFVVMCLYSPSRSKQMQHETYRIKTVCVSSMNRLLRCQL